MKSAPCRWSVLLSYARTILVVDDFEPFRNLVGSILRNRAGWEIIAEAADGFEAVEKARTLQPELILLDIALPKMNGIRVAEEILKSSPRCKIIFLTQEISVDVVQEAIRTRASGYLNKAKAVRDLVAAIDAVLRGERFIAAGLLPAGDLQALLRE